MKAGLWFALCCIGLTSAAFGQTALPSGLEIRLAPGYAYEPRQGFDSIVGGIAKKDGLTISFEIGGNPPPGAPRFGGSYVNQAKQLPAGDRLWLKEQEVGGRKVSIAYSKDQQLIVSSETAKEGVNFHTIAKTPEEVTEVLLMTLTLGEQKKKDK